MKDLKFTPGPWQIINLHSLDFAVRTDKGLICIVTKPSKYPGQDQRYLDEIKEMKANTELISKAPDMYSALLKARSVFQILLGPAVVSSISNYDLEKKIEQALSEINKVLES